MAEINGNRRKIVFWIIAIIIILSFFSTFIGWVVKWDWLDALGYQQVFWKIKGAQFLLFFVALIVALAYIIPNMIFLRKNVSFITLNLNFNDPQFGQIGIKEISERQFKVLLYVISLLIAFFFASTYFAKWNEWFQFIHPQSFGKLDPIFHHDIGFYIFHLPFLETIQTSLIYLVFFVTAISLVVYLAKGVITLKDIKNPHTQPIKELKHIAANVGLWFLLFAFGYFLERYQILYDYNGVVVGAGYTDVNVLLPVYTIMMILSLVMSAFSFYQAFKFNLKRFVIGIGAMVSIAIIGQLIAPTIVRSFVVKPNELRLEKPYLKNNIALTRNAYKLDSFQVTSFDAIDTLNYERIQNNIQTVKNIRLWDPRLIINTYKQLQEIRLYYSFPSVSIDRYHTDKGYQQVMLSAREINTMQLPQKSQTWVNQHLQYTHGFGITMSPVTAMDEDGNPKFYIENLPPVSHVNLQLKQPSLYYGEGIPTYKLVNTKVKELDYPKGKDNVYTHYSGTGGVSIGSFGKKLLYSFYFGDFNFLFTDYIQKGSRLQFWQDIQTRIKKIAPFLHLQDSPYLVLSNGKLYWMQDAYTSSNHYPYSQQIAGTFNYIRNSVKVVVDAYNGNVNFYISDNKDPLLKVYESVFPGMFKPLSDMPKGLKQHIRYPKFLFKVQSQIFNTYHMTNVQTFYNNEDLWEQPNSKYAGRQIKMQPYYILSKLPGQKRLQYLLINPLTPHNKDNMIAWMAAESDFPDYGKVHVYELPKSQLFLGPEQIEAKIDQTTTISRQISLWDQHGSNVIRGNLMVVPIDKSFLYVEPVFLIAQGVNIPQLKRVIVTDGENVVMKKTIQEAVDALFGNQSFEPIATTTISKATNAKIKKPNLSTAERLKLDSMKSLWNAIQQSLKNQQWQQFGIQMQKMDTLMKGN